MNVNSEIRLLSTRQVAELSGLGETTLRQMRTKTPYGGPPFLRIGSAVRYPLGQLQTWIEDRVQSAKQEANR